MIIQNNMDISLDHQDIFIIGEDEIAELGALAPTRHKFPDTLGTFRGKTSIP